MPKKLGRIILQGHAETGALVLRFVRGAPLYDNDNNT